MGHARSKIDPIDFHVGARVRQARILLGMSQEKLGDALGITFQQVQKNEKGVNRIGCSRLHRLSEILGRPIDWFFEGAPTAKGTKSPAPGADPLSQLGATTTGIALARAFNAIPDSTLRHAILANVAATAAVCNREYARSAA